MKNLVFVTGNLGKILSAYSQFKDNNLYLDWHNHNCDEPNINDIEFISKYKVKEAYEIVKRPCFVVDSGFYIDNYPGEPGFPGAFPKRAIINANGEKTGIEDLLFKMKDVKDRKCQFIDCLTYYDGVEFKTFFGISEGTLAYERKGIIQKESKSALWYIFIPKNNNKTLAEMTEEERNNRYDDRTSAILDFINWYKSNNKEESLKLLIK